MKNSFALGLATLSLLLAGCATPPAPQAFHNTDNSALVIVSLDSQNSQILQPTPTATVPNCEILENAKKLPQHQTAVVILENYTEPQVGPQFRDRSVPLFMGLRGLGYENIVFLRGKGVPSTEGLLALAEYN